MGEIKDTVDKMVSASLEHFYGAVAGDFESPAEYVADLVESERKGGTVSEWACDLLYADSPADDYVATAVRFFVGEMQEWAKGGK